MVYNQGNNPTQSHMARIAARGVTWRRNVMDRDEAHALRQMLTEHIERLNLVRERARRAKCALLDHDLEMVRYLLTQIEEASRLLSNVQGAAQAVGSAYHSRSPAIGVYEAGTSR
jgi:hypothetical protein